MDDLLADANDVSDAVYLAAIDAAASPEEIAFRDVLVFHRDFLNGGLSQALANKFDDLAQYLSAYRAIGLNWLAGMIELASTFAQDGESRDDFENADIKTLGTAYCAAAYGLAHASNLRREIRLTPDEKTSLTQSGDSVERLALRFARANRDKFRAVLAAASH
jgi:hypothetical protein